MRDSISAALGVRCAISGPVGLKTAPEPPRMPAVVPPKAYKQSGGATARSSLEARPGEKRGHRIDRHLMGRCSTTSSQIVGGHMLNDVRRCGGPIGSKRRQKRRSQVILHGFGRFLGEKGRVCCRVFCNASSDCRGPAGAAPRRSAMLRHPYSNLNARLALECQPVSSSGSKTASVNSLIREQS